MWTRGTITSTITQPVERPIFFEGLLDFYAGASAAYSLEHINGSYFGPVAKVRRASDNAERDVTADELKNGRAVDWVNATVALPLDTASGAAAAYSFCLLYTSPSPRDRTRSRMPSSA